MLGCTWSLGRWGERAPGTRARKGEGGEGELAGPGHCRERRARGRAGWGKGRGQPGEYLVAGGVERVGRGQAGRWGLRVPEEAWSHRQLRVQGGLGRSPALRDRGGAASRPGDRAQFQQTLKECPVPDAWPTSNVAGLGVSKEAFWPCSGPLCPSWDNGACIIAVCAQEGAEKQLWVPGCLCH